MLTSEARIPMLTDADLQVGGGMMKTEKPEGMIRTALFFTRPQMHKLQLLSDNSGAPVAELIRRAVDHYLELRKTEITVRK